MKIDDITASFIILIIVIIVLSPSVKQLIVLVTALIAAAAWRWKMVATPIEKFQPRHATAKWDLPPVQTPDVGSIDGLVDELFRDQFNGPTMNQDGDTLLAEKAREGAMKAKNSILHRARMTSDNFRKFYQEELDEQETRHWWEHDDLDALMVKDRD